MKNFLLAAILIMTLSANAVSFTGNIKLVISLRQEKEYKKVETTQVPAAVLKQASTKYSGFALNEAYASTDNEYKLVLKKDDKAVKAYYKSSGEFIKEEAK